ncbi:MAG: hypothetical protein RID15_13855 [Marinovum algicola]|uniref:hypothetical protein n=1 Tax=Pseudomonadota TaxID=1224 RepID=UPI0032EED8C2
MDAEIKNYLDANIRAASAENNASFARLEAKIDNIQPGATWQQAFGASVSAVVIGLGIVFAVLAFASDRFDSGIAAMGAIDETLDAQKALNESQEARLDRIIGVLEARNSDPRPTSEDTEN